MPNQGQINHTEQLGENVTARFDGNVITLTIDRNHRGGRSASGKTVRVASTRGNREFAGVVLGLNAYVKE